MFFFYLFVSVLFIFSLHRFSFIREKILSFCLMRIFIEIHEKLTTCACFMRDTITINLRLMTYNFTLFSTEHVFQSVSGNERLCAM